MESALREHQSSTTVRLKHLRKDKLPHSLLSLQQFLIFDERLQAGMLVCGHSILVSYGCPNCTHSHVYQHKVDMHCRRLVQLQHDNYHQYVRYALMHH